MLESGRAAEVPRAMPLTYPINLTSQLDGAILVSFPDVPEALTEGYNTREALDEARDCLVGALGGYIARGWKIPMPSEAKGRAAVQLSEQVTRKLDLYMVMQEHNFDRQALAKILDRPLDWVNKLLDLDVPSLEIDVHDALDAVEQGARHSIAAKPEVPPSPEAGM